MMEENLLPQSVHRRAAAFSISTPTELLCCQPEMIVWFGGVPPYDLNIWIAGSEWTSSPFERLGPGLEGTNFVWTVDIGPSTPLVLGVQDSTGKQQFSAVIRTAASMDNACLGGPVFETNTTTTTAQISISTSSDLDAQALTPPADVTTTAPRSSLSTSTTSPDITTSSYPSLSTTVTKSNFDSSMSSSSSPFTTSPSTPISSGAPTSTASHLGLSTGAIAGLSVMGTIVALLLLAAAFYLWRRHALKRGMGGNIDSSGSDLPGTSLGASVQLEHRVQPLKRRNS